MGGASLPDLSRLRFARVGQTPPAEKYAPDHAVMHNQGGFHIMKSRLCGVDGASVKITGRIEKSYDISC